MKPGKNLMRSLAVAALAIFIHASLAAERFSSPEWGYSVDLPEGFALDEKRGTDRYRFVHTLYPATLQLALYPKAQFAGADKALSFVTEQFSSTGTEVSFDWRKRKAAIGRIESKANAGWALAVELDADKGWLVLASYSDSGHATELEALMISALDAVYTDEGSYFVPGPMTTFAWPTEKLTRQKFQDGKKSFDVPFDVSDAGGNQSVVDREFSLLTAYLETDFVIAAWQRYYRMIWRDGWSRLEKASFIVGNAYPSDARALTEALLSWTQGFEYERNFNGADFTNLCDAFVSRKGDCDSRSLLMALMLNQLGVDAILLVSPEYSHAVVAVDCEGTGARFEYGGKKYLICDTTAKVAPGLIAADMADPAKWFAVSFGAFAR
jgi:hypothetical protein